MTNQSTPIPTPENTPLPGGGSWCWDDTVPGWIPAAEHTNLPVAPDAQETATEQAPAQE